MCRSPALSLPCLCESPSKKKDQHQLCLKKVSDGKRAGWMPHSQGTGVMGSDQHLGLGAAGEVTQVCTLAAVHQGTQRLCLGFWRHLQAALHLMLPSWDRRSLEESKFLPPQTSLLEETLWSSSHMAPFFLQPCCAEPRWCKRGGRNERAEVCLQASLQSPSNSLPSLAPPSVFEPQACRVFSRPVETRRCRTLS